MTKKVKAWNPLTLGELIYELNQLPKGAQVVGMGSEMDSYRGYYERIAIEPGEVYPASYLADQYEGQKGDEMHGYKGGTYKISPDEQVYLAEYGSLGPQICGFVELEPGMYEPLLVEETW